MRCSSLVDWPVYPRLRARYAGFNAHAQCGPTRDRLASIGADFQGVVALTLAVLAWVLASSQRTKLFADGVHRMALAGPRHRAGQRRRPLDHEPLARSRDPPLNRARRCGEPLWRRALPPLTCRLRDTSASGGPLCQPISFGEIPLRKAGRSLPVGAVSWGSDRSAIVSVGLAVERHALSTARRRTAAREDGEAARSVRRDRRPDHLAVTTKGDQTRRRENIALTARPPTRRFPWVVVRIARNAGFGQSNVYGLYAHGRVKEAYDGLCVTRFPRQSLPVSRASR